MKPAAELCDFDLLVEQHYDSLHRFALSLSRNFADACDLTQQAFFVAQTKRHQLREPAKFRSWLSTTIRRIFLQRRRHEASFPKNELSEVEHELPRVTADPFARLDGEMVMRALRSLDEHIREPLLLFYIEDRSYREIAATLGVPIGTVMSRLSRGKALLRRQFDPDPRKPRTLAAECPVQAASA